MASLDKWKCCQWKRKFTQQESDIMISLHTFWYALISAKICAEFGSQTDDIKLLLSTLLVTVVNCDVTMIYIYVSLFVLYVYAVGQGFLPEAIMAIGYCRCLRLSLVSNNK